MKNRFVTDTNVLVSYLLTDSKPRQAVLKAMRKGRILISENLISELTGVLNRKKFDKYISLQIRRDFVRSLTEKGFFVYPDEKITVCRDPKDNMILELAVCGNASCIITGDQDLLSLVNFRKIPILTPDEFLSSHEI
jgi:putative PIN family toxin of toxin-antitoxin system